ncbi:MAG: hypothetical protein HQ546_09960 [Planctomycetes bacterium]|nr:hypothetical protein [Planctomycetota bacterium]
MFASRPAGFDEDELVFAIAKGDKTYSQIAEAFGLAESTVVQIASGQIRPDLQARIEATARNFLAEARRLGSRAARHAIGTLVKLANAQDKDISAETRRKAAVDILKYAFFDSSDSTGQVDTRNAYPGLSSEDLELLAKMKDGPGE